MKVSELGEFGLIDLLAIMISDSKINQVAPNQLIIGIGDDAAAWRSDPSIQLATVDSMVQDVHFSLDTTSWRELGWKSLAINLSDIAAMGGVPTYALVALALPETTEVDDITKLYEGMIELARESQVAVVGGNISRSPVVSVTITVLGSSLANKILRRSTAKPGDTIAVTGHPGSAAAGLEMLKNKLALPPETARYLRDAFLHPVPRLAEGQLLAKRGVITAIDISDGLLSDLRHICEASQVSARLNVDLLPIHPAVKENFGKKARELALSGGEDYELLFTAAAAVVERIRAEMEHPVTVIGKITAGEHGKISLFDAGGRPVKMGQMGWEHF
ncbi:MAG: thiamine-phosphate kinase [Chloroflexi bacterium RBG_16_58_8]|nr:MAG: thiamine-phosphate kinase [Chloroflexi bacterium RBG_16_58_8]